MAIMMMMMCVLQLIMAFYDHANDDDDVRTTINNDEYLSFPPSFLITATITAITRLLIFPLQWIVLDIALFISTF